MAIKMTEVALSEQRGAWTLSFRPAPRGNKLPDHKLPSNLQLRGNLTKVSFTNYQSLH